MGIQSKENSNSLLELFLKELGKPKTKFMSMALIATIILLIKLRPKKPEITLTEPVQKKKSKARVDKEFLISICKLLKIVIPRPLCSETLSIFSLSFFLVIRTFLSIYIAEVFLQINKVNGKIVKSIIDVTFSGFLKNIMKLVLLAVPGSFLNSYLEYLRKKLTS